MFRVLLSRTLSGYRVYSQLQCNNPAQINKKIGFIGDGNMAKAICKAMEIKGLISYQQVTVSSPYIKNLNSWKDLGAHVTTSNERVVEDADVIFLAIKPVIFPLVMSELQKSPNAQNIKNKLFLSILAGISLNDLEKIVLKYDGSRVVRIMPNIPMMVGEGCTVYCPGQNVTDEDQTLVRTILEVCGTCEKIPEHMINAAGALSGSGPSFAYLFIEALSDGAVRMGVHRDMASKFAAQTVLGAAKMVLETGKHTGVLKDEVCSAGGMTIAGMHALERGGVRGAVMDAVQAAAEKAVELGKKK